MRIASGLQVRYTVVGGPATSWRLDLADMDA